MFTLLFILTIFPIFPSLMKIYRRQGLNMFDITVVFSSLYFWAIPVKDFLVNHLRPEYIQNTPTALAVCLYMWLMGWLAYVYSHKKRSPLYITDRLAEVKMVQVKDSFQWFALVYIGYMLFQITNYSALGDDNIEGNNNFFYGTGVGFLIKLIVVPFRAFFPALLLILWNNKPRRPLYRKLRKVNLFLVLASLLLGAKGFMVLNITFLALYLYSLKRHQLSRKQIISYCGAIVVILAIVFPISQSFRYYKQDAVMHSKEHDFVSVAMGFISEGVSDDLKQRVENYEQGRSLNLYDAVDFAASRTEYRGYGHLTGMILRYIIPQRMHNDGNIMADMMRGGGDVGESIFAWYVLDWGAVLGAVIAVLHHLFLFVLYYYFGIFFNRWIRSSVYPIVIYSVILRIAVGVEHNPVIDIKAIYNTYYIIIIFSGIILCYFQNRTKKMV